MNVPMNCRSITAGSDCCYSALRSRGPAGRQDWQEGRRAKYDMETFDDVLVQASNGFMDKASTRS
jgi:hypothetical protein